MNEDLESMLAEADEIAAKIHELELQFRLLLVRYQNLKERPPFDMEALEW